MLFRSLETRDFNDKIINRYEINRGKLNNLSSDVNINDITFHPKEVVMYYYDNKNKLRSISNFF